MHEKIIVVRHDVSKTVNQSTYLFLFSLTTDAADPEFDPNSKKPVPDSENYWLRVFFVRIRLHQLFISIFSKMSDLPSLFYGSEVRQYINRIFRKGSVNGFSLKLVSGNFLNPETGSLLLFLSGSGFSRIRIRLRLRPICWQRENRTSIYFLLAFQTRITCDMLHVTN